MAGYNKVLLLGNLTRDPQLSYTPNQTAVVDFGVATNRKWTGQDGSQREETCFVDCRAFGTTAENINKFFSKGQADFHRGEADLRFLDGPGWIEKEQAPGDGREFPVPAGHRRTGTGTGTRRRAARAGIRRGRTAPRGRPNEPIPDSEIPF